MTAETPNDRYARPLSPEEQDAMSNSEMEDWIRGNFAYRASRLSPSKQRQLKAYIRAQPDMINALVRLALLESSDEDGIVVDWRGPVAVAQLIEETGWTPTPPTAA